MLKASQRRHAERGQVLPLWIAGTIAALALAFLTANYANSVRYEIRAQNAADSAASAVVAIQSDQWNMMTALLYADDIEEFRFRRILDGMLLAIHRSGGCNPGGYVTPSPTYTAYPQPQSWYSTAEGTCNRTYIDLRDNLIRSHARYQKNENYLNDIALQATFSNFQSNAASMLTSLQANCNTDSSTITNPIGGDCGNGNGSNTIKYSFAPASTSTGYGGMTSGASAIAYRTGLGAVELDAANYLIPGLGVSASKHGLDSETQSLWAPVAVDVVACEKITPLIPSFGPFKQSTYYAVGRAAATNAMVNQEWLEPEVMGLAKAEFYTQYTPDNGFGSASISNPLYSYGANQLYDWYSVDFGGNNYTANGTNFTANLQWNEFSAIMGWWAPIPILPFGGAVSTASAC